MGNPHNSFRLVIWTKLVIFSNIKHATDNDFYFKKTSNFMLQLDLTTFFNQKNPG